MKRNTVDKFVAAVIEMDTRLVEISFAGLMIIRGVLLISRQQIPLLDVYVYQLFHSVRLGAYESALFGSAMVIIGLMLLYSSVQGMVKNNHYKSRALWMFAVTSVWLMNGLAGYFSGMTIAAMILLSWPAIIALFSTLLLLMKSEAVRLGCPSIRGSLAVLPSRIDIKPADFNARHIH